MTLTAAWERVRQGATVTVRPRGASMVGLVPDGATVVVTPVNTALLEVGDVVLAKVAGRVYLHKVTAVDVPRQRVQIGNNRGRINGWTAMGKVAGLCVSVDGVDRPRTAGKSTA